MLTVIATISSKSRITSGLDDDSDHLFLTSVAVLSRGQS